LGRSASTERVNDAELGLALIPCLTPREDEGNNAMITVKRL
jgi:hypothetical protein